MVYHRQIVLALIEQFNPQRVRRFVGIVYMCPCGPRSLKVWLRHPVASWRLFRSDVRYWGYTMDLREAYAVVNARRRQQAVRFALAYLDQTPVLKEEDVAFVGSALVKGNTSKED